MKYGELKTISIILLLSVCLISARPLHAQLFSQDYSILFDESHITFDIQTHQVNIVKSGDFDNDGKIDLFVTWYGTSPAGWRAGFFRNISTGSNIEFQKIPFNITYHIEAAEWMDYNNDGYLDLMISIDFGSGNLYALINNGDGTFSYKYFQSGVNIEGIEWGDVDADGDIDILLNHASGSELFIQNSIKNLVFRDDLSLEAHSSLIDYDNDGDLDIVASRILTNRENDFIETHDLVLGEMESTGLNPVSGDIDSDGDQDIVMNINDGKNSNSKIVIFTNDNNVFTGDDSGLDFALYNGKIRINDLADYNLNSDLDVLGIATTEGYYGKGYIDIYENGISIYNYENNSGSLIQDGVDGYTKGDYDGDGDLDFIVSGYFYYTGSPDYYYYFCRLQKNNSVTTNNLPASVTGLSSIVNGSTVTLNWDESGNNEAYGQPNYYNFYVRRGDDTIRSSMSLQSGAYKLSTRNQLVYKTAYSLKQVPNGTYYWAVQSVDPSFLSSPFSEEMSFEVNNGFPYSGFIDELGSVDIRSDKTGGTIALAGKKSNDIQLTVLEAATYQKIIPPASVENTFSGVGSVKLRIDPDENYYILAWIGDKSGETDKVWIEVLDDEMGVIAVPLEISHTEAQKLNSRVRDFDIEIDPVSNTIFVFWSYYISTGLEKGIAFRKLNYDAGGMTASGIVLLDSDTDDLSGDVTGLGYTDVQLERFPQNNDLVVGYVYDLGEMYPNPKARNIFFGLLDEEGSWLQEDLVPEKYTSGASPKMVLNPYDSTVFCTWMTFFTFEDPNNFAIYFYDDEVAGQRITLQDDTLIFDIQNETLSHSSYQGGSGGSANHQMAFNDARNEYLVFWKNTNEDTYNGRRINAFDNQIVEPDEFLISGIEGTLPVAAFSIPQNEFLIASTASSSTALNVYDPPNDIPPVLNSLDKYAAYGGEKVLINGNYFNQLPYLNRVYFGTAEATILDKYYDRIHLQVIVPEGLTREPVPVTVSYDGQTGSSEGNFLFEPLTLPFIDSLSSYEGEHGDTLRIYGDKFSETAEEMEIRFGNIPVKDFDVLSSAQTMISLVVPDDIPRGMDSVSVTIQGQRVNAPQAFRTIIAPQISDVNPIRGLSCDPVTIQGSNFSDSKDSLQVMFGAIEVDGTDIISATTTALIVRVPAGAGDSVAVSVRTDKRTAVYKDEFYAQPATEILRSIGDEYIMFNEGYSGTDVGVEIRGSCTLDTIRVYYREYGSGSAMDTVGIPKAGDQLTEEGVRYTILLDSGYYADRQGLEYYVEVRDIGGPVYRTDTLRTYRQEIKGIEPKVGEPGEEVMVVGQNLPLNYQDVVINFISGQTVLKVQEDEFNPEKSTEDTLYFSVPQASVRGHYEVEINLRGDLYRDSEGYRVIEQPQILRVNPESGTSCDAISLGGDHFPDDEDGLMLYFGDSKVSKQDILYISSDSLVVNVPQGVSGKVKIRLESDGLESVYDKDFEAKLGVEIRDSLYTPVIELYNSQKADEVEVGVQLENDCSLAGDVVMRYEGITERDNWREGEVATVGSEFWYRVTLGETDFSQDPIGIRYYFEMADQSGDTINSGEQYIYKYWVEGDSTETDMTPELVFGTNLSDYQVVSFPYRFTPGDVNVVLKGLPYEGGKTNIKKWRMYHYDGEQQSEYEYGEGPFSDIETGQGYWMLLKERQRIVLSGGQTVNLYDGGGVILYPGWNQVGNPYIFTLNWQEVLEANGDPSDLEGLKVYDRGVWKESTSLKAYQGGFVRHNGSDALSLKIPYRPEAAAGGRLKTASGDQDREEGWRLDLSFGSGSRALNQQIGVITGAREGADRYDTHHLPEGREILSMAFWQGGRRLYRDIRGGEGLEQWAMTLINETGGSGTLSWEEPAGLPAGRVLMIRKPGSMHLIDMGEVHRLGTGKERRSEYAIYYGTREQIEAAQRGGEWQVGEAYPNPFTGRVSIPVYRGGETGGQMIRLRMVDMEGRLVYEGTARTGRGYDEIVLDDRTTGGLRAGIYQVILQTEEGLTRQVRLIKK